MKYKLLLIFTLGIALGVLFTSAYWSLSPDRGALFVKTCSDLNGQDLTLENIKKLNGNAFVGINPSGVGVGTLKEEYIEQYLTYLKTGQRSQTLRSLAISTYDNSFTISRGALEGDWRCSIKIDASTKIKTSAYYNYVDEIPYPLLRLPN